MASQGIEWLRRRVLFTLIPAFAGGLLGAYYAKATLPQHLLETSSLGAMYAAGGAASMLLAMRIVTIVRLMIRTFRPPKDEEPTHPEGE